MASTVKEQHINQIEVMKSKFIAYLLPLDNEENFKTILAALRKEHKKACSHRYAGEGNGWTNAGQSFRDPAAEGWRYFGI